MTYDLPKSLQGKSLRTQFNYVKNQLKRTLISEMAGSRARGLGSIEAKPSLMFKNLDFENVFKHGFTRKEKGKTVRYTGEKAVKIQIQSMRARSLKSKKKQQFIDNYCEALDELGVETSKIRKKLEKVSEDKLALLISKGILPSINYLYGVGTNVQYDIEQDIINAIDYGVTSEEIKKYRERKKQLIQVVKKEAEINEWI